ncbi:MAG: hypothetical protein H0U29_13935 [Acidimicrobiia bacterium]|nr:hypothetical protein [Acidimicrobiia bacterium]
MAAWFIELLNPFAGYAMWRQRRTQAPSVEPDGAPEADRTDDRPLVVVGGDDR